jgi:adenosylcobinamide kinase/adenosylcobinamide-phosphate guanylyltransferase
LGETILILGGARSGKSRTAAKLAQEAPPVTYVATATVDPNDPEMVARIDRHRLDRPADWSTVEIPRGLDAQLPALAARGGSVVIDCVTLWVSNLILGLGGGPAASDDDVLTTVERAASAARGEARVVWVSNEVGHGIVPANPLARRFADLQGLVNQLLAERCDRVYLCVAGIPVRLKGTG